MIRFVDLEGDEAAGQYCHERAVLMTVWQNDDLQ